MPIRKFDPCDPLDAFDLMDMAQAAKEARQPKCACCGRPIMTEDYINLEPFGIDGYGCGTCLERNTHSTEDWEE